MGRLRVHPYVAHELEALTYGSQPPFVVLTDRSLMGHPSWITHGFRGIAHESPMGLEFWPVGRPWTTDESVVLVHGSPMGRFVLAHGSHSTGQWVTHAFVPLVYIAFMGRP